VPRCWSTKAASETRKDREKGTMEYVGPIGTHQRSFERCHPRPPTAFPKIGG